MYTNKTVKFSTAVPMSFHMQVLCRILGIRWYDKVSNAEVNERTKLPYYICRLPENTPALQALQLSIEAQPALLPPLTGSARRVIHK